MSNQMQALLFAESYLAARGWTYSGDARKLGAKIEDCCEDFIKDLEAAYEEASHDR